MIKQRFDSRGVRQLVICKVENPKTKKNPGYSTNFSWELWNTPAQEYMQSIEALSYKRTLEIFKEAYQLTDWLGRRSPFIQVDNDISNVACASLHSNDEDPGTFDDGVDGTEHQADDGSWDSNVNNAQARVQGGATTADHDGDNLDCHLLSTSKQV